MSRLVTKRTMAMVTEILKVDKASISFGPGGQPEISDPTTQKHLERAAQILTSPGGVVAFPTETVYGLGGLALSDDSVKAIYAAKNRPADNPLIVHVASVEQLERKLLSPGQKIPAQYARLVEAFWPGPLTILVPLGSGPSLVSTYVTAGQPTVGVRIPAHPVARALIAMSDTPVAAPSANALTRPSPTEARHVYRDLAGRIPVVLDGGACAVGVELSVVDGTVLPPMLLRPGGVSLEQIVACDPEGWGDVVVGKKTADANEAVRTPGMKYRHYSPTAKVVLFNGCGNGVESVRAYAASVSGSKFALLRLTNFAAGVGAGADFNVVFDRHLGVSADEVSRNLFAALRDADDLGADIILVEGIEEIGAGMAVMNRLSKAAAEVIEGK